MNLLFQGSKSGGLTFRIIWDKIGVQQKKEIHVDKPSGNSV